MKPSNRISAFMFELNSIFVCVLQAARRVPLLAMLLTVAFFLLPNGAMAGGLLEAGPYTAQQNGGVLISNFNSAGVQSGLAANLGTIFTLEPGATYNLSGIVTYQWGGGKGAPSGGTIDIENQYQQVIRTFNVSVQPASFGVPANWVVTINPPMQLGPGMYIVRSSSPSTQANNGLSNGCLWFNPGFQCGFVKIFGSATLPPPPSSGGSRGGSSAGGSTPFYPVTKAWCTSTAVPSGWLVTNQTTSYTSCPYYGSYLTDNVETIEQYSNAPIGTTLFVCTSWATVPSGWAVQYKTTTSAQCPYYGGYYPNNVEAIKRIN